MLALGFSSGLPFMLIFSTLSAWLSQSGIRRATIGMLSWVSLVYTLKFVWSPVVDRLRLPLIGRALGQRRSWMLLAQASIGVALLTIAGSNPKDRCAARGDAGAVAGVFRGHAGHRHRRLAHRVRSGTGAGQHGGGLSARLPHRDPGRPGRRALDRRNFGLGPRLLDHGAARIDRHRDHAAGARAATRRPAGIGAHRAARDRLAGASRALAGLAAPLPAPGFLAPSFARSSISSRVSGRRSGCCCSPSSAPIG